MDRRRKGYLLRKTDYLDHLNYNPQVNGNAVCSCDKSSARSYDLQTQTITFEEEQPIIINRGVPLPKTFVEVNQKVPDNSNPMDQDLEFYPVDDHPTPSTFTAWDAFLAGNQAFFREPPSLLPDPAFSYMDVIPEEDDLEALLESDTDDTGSSVSTVIDRFSRTSTANSSFSERCKGTGDVTFDLQKVLSPFERLEKELDGDESKDEHLRRKVVSRGPIVVITNSSSCEDVHSAEEEETSKSSENSVQNKIKEELSNNKTDKPIDSNGAIPKLENSIPSNESKECEAVEKSVENGKCSNLETKQVDIAKIPQVPVRSKLTNGSKMPEKQRIKSDKTDGSPPLSNHKKKKSYPTPSVPPRMSKHLPARRTRSDPGTPDPPSRIPRPITNTSRSPSVANNSPKASSKNNRSPKLNTDKKLKITGSPKSSRNISKTSIIPPESPVLEAKSQTKVNKANNKPGFEDNFVEYVPEADKPTFEDNFVELDSKCSDAKNSAAKADDEPVQESNNLIETYETLPGDTATILVTDESQVDDNGGNGNLDPTIDSSKFVVDSNTSEEHSRNPFRNNDTNPFKSAINESKNPFLACNNPFEENSEVTPVLQPKGQMSASLIAPPIPERPSLIASQKRENIPEPFTSSSNTVVNCKQTVSGQKSENNNSNKTKEQNAFIDCVDKENSPANILEKTEVLSSTSVHEAIEAALNEMDILERKAVTTESSLATDSDQNHLAGKDESPESDDKSSGPQRPIEDILQALDKLVLSAPREVEISIDWGVRGPVNIREKTVLPSDASGDRSDISETDGLPDDRQRDIETLLKEVDECLKLRKVNEDLSTQQPIEESPLPASDSYLLLNERTSLGPGSLDAPTAGSTPLNLCQHEEQATHDTNILLEQPASEMLKHQSQSIITGEQRVGYSVPYQEVYSKTTEQLDEESLISKHHSSGCDDSGVFLEDPIASSPETQSRSAVNRLQSTLDKFSSESAKMRQYSIHEGLDSDAEKSDDLGLASSSIDSADDLDGDPLPSTLQISSCPPVVTTKQKPPPVPARKSVSKSSDYQKNNRYYSEITALEVPSHQKPPLSKCSSSGEDSNFGEGDHCLVENNCFSLSEKSKNIINNHKNEQSRSNFAMTRSFHEEMLSNQQRDSSQDSKTNFLSRTLNNLGKKCDVPNGNSSYCRKNNEQPSSFKWKSEECLRTAAENKWCIPGRRYEKSVSVKDRIAMFSEMETNQVSSKRDDLQRYGSENNIKAITGNGEIKKTDVTAAETNKSVNLLKDSKWHSMHSITKKPIEKETPYVSTTMKPALSIPSLTSNNLIDNLSNNNYATPPVKVEVEPPKPIVEPRIGYPETQLTNNKRYNSCLYSLQNLKNTEILLSKKAAAPNILSIIDSRKQSTQKLKGLVIPEKPYQANGSKELPTIVSSDSDSLKDTRRGSLPITAVTAAKAMSLPRNKKLECVPAQRQTSLTEPPWKNESNSSYTLPKYSPAFKKRSLELPGSSLSPTPPSSITSPMSPPPSSPSSICSSNASSTLQQNVFQFSLSHSKPVQPLQPEKALMSPPSLPSDVEYEGDNSEDSSHSASPMRGSARNNKETKTSTQLNPNTIQFGKSNAFTSSAKGISHQPMMVETLVKPTTLPPETEPPKPKAAIYLSKTEILLKKDEPRPDLLSRDQDLLSNEFVSKTNDQIPIESSNYKTNGTLKEDCFPQMNVAEIQLHEKKNGDLQYSPEYFPSNGSLRNGVVTNTQSFAASSETSQQDITLGKFRAFPLNLKDSETVNPLMLENKNKLSHNPPSWRNGRPPQSECDESDDDSHSTLSHRTEDSRHTTTDDCLSDATTDSFEKPRLLPEPPHLQRSNDDNASTEGYLSDASTDVSIRRFTNRPIDASAYSTEEYLSDATAESPDPEWISNRGLMEQHTYHRSKSYGGTEIINHSYNVREEEGSESTDKVADPDLRPRRLSQQKTVLKAVVEPSGSVQKFKALAEKWEQRSDVISPPPPVVAPLPPKKESKAQSIASGIITSSCVTSTLIKGKSSLPPSLMPRNSSEKKTSQSSKSSSKESLFTVRSSEKEMTTSIDGIVTRKSISSTSTVVETTPGWNPHPYDELNRLESFQRRDSTSSASNSSKTTLKEDEVFDSPPPLQLETNGYDGAKYDAAIPVVTNSAADIANSQSSQRPSQVSLSIRQDDIFNNEPRNRRGADFSRSNPIPDWPKSNRPAFGAKSTFSVSDIRRSFENGSKEVEKSQPPKKPPMPATRLNAPAASVPPPPVPTRKASVTSETIFECDDDLKTSVESARNQLKAEGVSNQFDVLTVVLRREGEGGGSVGITLAGGADYEVKEITVHKVISGSIADRDGRVSKGDRVMFINGRDLRGVSHGEALHILKAPSPIVALVLARDRNGQALQQNGTMDREIKRRPDFSNNKDSETIVVELLKDAAGLGFSIEGGRDSPQGDRPLLIKRLFKGGAADKDGQLEEGDEIVSVNNQPVINMTRTEAWNFLKKLPEGPVLIQARKASVAA